MLRRLFVALTLAVSVAACNGGSTSPPLGTGNPTPTPTPSPTPAPPAQHLYVGNDRTPGQIQVFNLPVTAASTSTATIASNNVVTVAVDASGNLAAGDNAGNQRFYPAPLTSASTPSATFANGSGPNSVQNVFLATGDFWVSTGGNRVNRFNTPFSNASTPAQFITNAALTGATGTGIDSAQNLYISNDSFVSGSNLFVYAPPYTGVPIMTQLIFGTHYRKIAVSATQLFVCHVMGKITDLGHVDVYTLPITAASVPAAEITTGMNLPEGVALDAAGNLYVGNIGDATVRVYSPPFSGASAPVAALTVGQAPFGAFGITIGK